MWPFTRTPVVPVLRLSGAIGMATPLRPGLSITTLAEARQQAFEMSKTPAVALIINSPGGSAVQSSLILKRIRALADEFENRLLLFGEGLRGVGRGRGAHRCPFLVPDHNPAR